MNYRKLYKKETKRPIPLTFEIHHIDGDRSNNDIMNLVALPKELHTDFHKSAINIKDWTFSMQMDGVSDCDTFRIIEEASVFAVFQSECNKWCAYRNYLLGLTPFDVFRLDSQYTTSSH